MSGSPVNWRVGTAADVPAVVHVAEAMHARSRLAALPWEPGRLQKMLTTAVDSDSGLFLVVADRGEIVGGFAAFVIEHWFTRALAATELGMFVRPEHHGGLVCLRMLKGYIAWARKLGVPDELILCSALGDAEAQAYTAAGFKRAGSVFALQEN